MIRDDAWFEEQYYSLRDKLNKIPGLNLTLDYEEAKQRKTERSYPGIESIYFTHEPFNPELANDYKIPDVMTSRAVFDEYTGEYLGHAVDWEYQSELDFDGSDALYFGGRYYDEGMRLVDPPLKSCRQECFEAAEILYLHAANKGNAKGYLCLGYIYYYDRCNGWYFKNASDSGNGKDYKRFPVEEQAFECFMAAVEAGLAEAWYKLGDCYKNGIGCEVDEKEAFACYKQAVESDDDLAPYLTGSIALRLAGCYEDGTGCEHDFERALEYYERAEQFLDAAVSSGDWYYKKSLQGARDGIIRCKQEISLSE